MKDDEMSDPTTVTVVVVVAISGLFVDVVVHEVTVETMAGPFKC
jgi:hypothetical protein